MNWTAPQKPADYAEQTLITAILDSTYPPGSTLPAERTLAEYLGVTRPTLREVLRRLERDGWITIQHGKPTQVNEIWRDGGLNILSGIVRYSQHLPENFILNLLGVRLTLAPTFTALAVEHQPDAVRDLLVDHAALDDTPEAFAAYDWHVQRTLTILSQNPIYTLILNGFADFYEDMARRYFRQLDARAASRAFYAALLDAVSDHDADRAEQITRRTMQESITFWQQTNGHSTGPGGDV